MNISLRSTESGFVILWLLLTSAYGCNDARGSQSSVHRLPVARLGEQEITLDDVDGSLGQYIYELRADALKALLMESLLRREGVTRGISPDAVYKAEVTDKLEGTSADELRAHYEEALREGHIEPGTDYAVYAEQLANAKHRIAERKLRSRLFGELAKKADVAIDHGVLGHRPAQAISRGPGVRSAAARVSIVEFADYTARFVPLGNEALRQIVGEFGDKVEVAFRVAPERAESSQRVALSALCAEEQQAFVEFRERLLEKPVKQTNAELEEAAASQGLDVARFSECLRSGRQEKLMEEHLADYKRNQLQGQPAWIINGFRFGGAIPIEDFRAIVSAMIDGTYLGRQ